VGDLGRLDRPAILSLQRSAGNAAVGRLLKRAPTSRRTIQRQADDPRSPKQLCGAGEIDGQVYMCCHPNPYFHEPECAAAHKRAFEECWEKTAKDEQAVETCSGVANFANCRCLERHRSGYCSCGGLV